MSRWLQKQSKQTVSREPRASSSARLYLCFTILSVKPACRVTCALQSISGALFQNKLSTAASRRSVSINTFQCDPSPPLPQLREFTPTFQPTPLSVAVGRAQGAFSHAADEGKTLWLSPLFFPDKYTGQWSGGNYRVALPCAHLLPLQLSERSKVLFFFLFLIFSLSRLKAEPRKTQYS